jgi:hypothetical protein
MKKCKYCGKKISREGPHYRHNPKCYAKYKEDKELEKERLRRQNNLVKCEICGFEGKTLIRHITDKHNMTVKEYKEKYGPVVSQSYSEFFVDFWKERNVGEDNPMFGIHPWNTDSERKEEIREKLGKTWRGKKFSKTMRNKMAGAKRGITGKDANAYGPHNVSEDGRRRMREGSLKSKNINHSKGEIELGVYLYEIFEDCQWACSIDFYECDYFIPSRSLVIEYDGDWYHSGIHFGTTNSATQRTVLKNDIKKTKQILSRGYGLVRILESEFLLHKKKGDVRRWLKSLLA